VRGHRDVVDCGDRVGPARHDEVNIGFNMACMGLYYLAFTVTLLACISGSTARKYKRPFFTRQLPNF
jgi:hypothetical protein